MGDRGIMLMKGSLDLHGNREHSWTKLADTAQKGSRQITVLNAADWRAGDPHRARLDRLQSAPGPKCATSSPSRALR